MSAERLSFAFNSLIPETYKNKAEAFAKCLHHKLLSLSGIDPSPGPPTLNSDTHSDVPPTTPPPPQNTRHSPEQLPPHSEPDNPHCGAPRTNPSLTSMSSDDSTLDSWSSCQDNLTDLDKLDSETEELSALAAQVKGSPKLRTFNMRAKRKELREKTRKRNPRRNHSSSTESIDSEGARQGLLGRPADDFDREFSSHCILLDGLQPEDDDVPHRILRESSSTSSLDSHFFSQDTPRGLHIPHKVNKTPSEDRPLGADAQLLTPPPSPDLHRKPPQPFHPLKDDLDPPIHFAHIETDSGEVDFLEVEWLKVAGIHDLCRPVKKVGGVIVESSQLDESPSDNFVITRVEVLQDTPRTEGGTSGVVGPDPQQQTDIYAPEDDDILNSRSTMRRCSSLKTWKTPPGTPGSKKIVRFADALGLDLADVRTFLDDIPKIPTSAYDDLHFDLPAPDSLPPPPPSHPPCTLVPLFRPPAAHPDFLHKIRHQKISLETTLVALDGVPTVTGYVRVHNIAYHKSVHVRYTLNNWGTFSDLQATYVPNSCDGFSDRFSFALYGHTLKIGEKLEFALRLECCGGQYWDNNGGANYAFQCLPRTSACGFFSSPYGSETDPWFDFY